MDMPRELSPARCVELLAAETVGRVALCTPSGPHIVPVNYVVVDEAILFRTAPYSVLGTVGWTSPLAFEVDHLDHEHRRGWSVVATGRGEVFPALDTSTALREADWPQPWAGGSRHLCLRLAWDSITGREIAGRGDVA